MNKTFKGLVIGTIIGATLTTATIGFAENGVKGIEAYYKNIKVKINGVTKESEKEPFIVDGSTYVPLRFISEAFNKDVNWDGKTNTVLITDKKETANNFTVKVNKTLEQNGIKLTLNTIVVDEKGSKLNFTLENKTSNPISFYGTSTIILQEPNQIEHDFATSLNFDNKKSFPSEILPNIISTGDVIMPVINKDIKKATIKVEVYDKKDYKVNNFEFNPTW